LEQAIQLMKEHWFDSIQLIVFPETMIIEAVNEATIYNNKWITLLKESIPELSKTSILTGAFTRRNATEAPKDQQAIITDTNSYLLYNSSLLIQKDTIQIYHKHQLVPLVEKQPFFWLMKPLQKYIEKSGGFFGRYGTYNSSTTFKLNDSTKIAPLICFESTFGDYTSSAQNGSSFIVLITNDGWWSSKAGYLQHLALARLRAIESGKWIIRCANTGVSAIINYKGRIIHQTQYGEAAVINADVLLVNDSTFYTAYGEMIGKITLMLSIVFLSIILLKKHQT
ncbi:MAG: apolipoprotein N-acyltransferase, partial [Ignavibacteria bacterium]|nr:apolipoprotein N-acyltransferase [Ignavibacteria bacterium]